MTILSYDKIYHSSAFNYPQNEKADQYEPSISLFEHYLNKGTSKCICRGVSFWKFDGDGLADSAAPEALIPELLSLPQLSEIYTYTPFLEKINKIRSEDLRHIKDLEAELQDRCYSFSDTTSITPEQGKSYIRDFIQVYGLSAYTIYRADFPWCDWFAGDGCDSFLLGYNAHSFWFMNFYESD